MRSIFQVLFGSFSYKFQTDDKAIRYPIIDEEEYTYSIEPMRGHGFGSATPYRSMLL
ncbi:hypothetical protein BT69DRAFT_1277679 [Atractiella rhizophila]|nr:hypothetical protein BT69DRAFT_1277679 [Atractiella rhizophila]